MTKYLFIAIILQFPFNILADIARIKFESPYFSLYQAAIVVYGAVIFVYVAKKIIPQILEKSEIRKRSKK